MIVCKFGGTSVACAQSAKNIKEIVGGNKNRKIIVVSALGKSDDFNYKITDKLFYLFSLVKDKENYNVVLDEIFDRYIKMSNLLNVKINWNAHKTKLKTEIKNNKVSRDYIVSRGEYYSAILYSKFLGAKFLDAKDYIRFDQKGKLNQAKTKQLLLKLDKSKKYVIGGYYGADKNGNIKVFDRGGSDITGAVICKCLNLDVYENYTDVVGVYNKNPNLFKSAKNLPVLDYKTALGMADGGNEVVHKDALKLIKNSNILLLVKSTKDYKKLGSIVTKDDVKNNHLFICTSSEDVLVFNKINKTQLNFIYQNAEVEKIVFIKNKYYILVKSLYFKIEKMQKINGFEYSTKCNKFLFFSNNSLKNNKNIKKLTKKCKKYAIFITFLSYFNNLLITTKTKDKETVINLINKYLK